MMQRRRSGATVDPGGAVPVILITHATHEKSVRLASKPRSPMDFWPKSRRRDPDRTRVIDPPGLSRGQ
jgi:hypothetical protein